MVQWQIEIADGLGVHHLNPGDPAPEGCVRLCHNPLASVMDNYFTQPCSVVGSVS